MKTSENAPRSLGRTSSAPCSNGVPSSPSIEQAANSSVIRSLSEVAPRSLPISSPLALAWVTIALSSAVLVRLPLCPSAMAPWPAARKVGWAFSQTEEPVVE
jgi:hypothetical protein